MFGGQTRTTMWTWRCHMGVERRASAEPAGGGLPRPEMPPTALGSAGGSLLRPPGAEKGGEEPVACGG